MAVENGMRPLQAAVRSKRGQGDARRLTRVARTFERRSVFPYLLIAPLIGALIFLTYIPIIEGLRLSLTDAMLGASSSKFIGLANFTSLVKEPLFWQTFFQTVVWTVASVGLALVFGVAAGLSLRSVKRRSGVMRAVLLLPWAAPPVVIAYMWRFLLSPTGPLSPYLVTLGLAKEPPDVLSSLSSFHGLSPPLMAVIALGVWSGIPFVFIFAVAALSAIPPEIQEASRLDGATGIQSFRWVTWPLMRPVVETTAVLLALVRFGGLDLPFLLTAGGPNNESNIFGVWIYNTAFSSLQSGLAAAMGVIVFLIALPLSLLYVRRSLRSVTGEESRA